MLLERCDRCREEHQVGYNTGNWMDVKYSRRQETTTVIKNGSYCPLCTSLLKELMENFNNSKLGSK